MHLLVVSQLFLSKEASSITRGETSTLVERSSSVSLRPLRRVYKRRNKNKENAKGERPAYYFNSLFLMFTARPDPDLFKCAFKIK